MFDKCKNSNQQGNVGLAAAIKWFTVNGYTILLPLTDSQDYDMVVDKNGFKRVQIKTTRTKSPYDVYVVDLRVNGGNKSGTGKTKYLDNKFIDLLFVLTEQGTQYLIPTNKLKQHQRHINLGDKYDSFKL